MVYQAAIEFKTLLSTSTTFQTFVEAEDADEALEKIILFRTDEIEALTKYAVILLTPNFSWSRRSPATGPAAYSRSEGCQFGIFSEVDKFSEDNASAFITSVQGILNDLISLSGNQSSFRISNIAHIDPPFLEKGESPFHWMDGGKQGYHIYFNIERNNI